MTVTLQRTLKDAGPTAAGQILAPVLNFGEGVSATLPAWNGSGQTTIGGTSYYGAGDGAGNATNCGYRRAFGSAQDFTDRQFIQWRVALGADLGDSGRQKKWAAGGGCVIFFYDGSGNFAGYKFAAGDTNWFAPPTGSQFGGSDGAFRAFSGLTAFTTPFFHLDRTRTPDYSSGTLNWAAVAGYEVHFRPIATFGGMLIQFCLAQMYTVDNPMVKGAGGVTTGVDDLQTGIATLSDVPFAVSMMFKGTPNFPMFGGAPSPSYWSAIGVQIGDGGTTATTGTWAGAIIGFLNPPEDTHDTAPVRNYGLQGYILPGTTSRLFDVYQGASDSVTVNDQSWASTRAWGLRVRGTPGFAGFNRCIFTRPSQSDCGHGTFTDCIWDSPSAPVKVTPATSMTRCTVRNGSNGIQVTGAAGTFNIDATIGGASSYDIQVGSGGAGTFSFPNLKASATLKIRNDSATNAVVVGIPAGIAYTASTAGGSITVELPPATIDASVTNIVPGSRIQVYNETTATELANEIVAGTSWTSSTDLGVNYTPGDVVRVRLAWCDGSTAKLAFQARAVVGSTNWSVLAEQSDDTVYNGNGINGSTVTEYTADFPNIQIDINDVDGNTTPQRGYAWYVYAIANDADSMRYYFGAMTAEDALNYVMEDSVVDVRLDNVGTNSVSVTGAAIRRRDGTNPIAETSGKLHLWAGRVYAVETGVSGLTPTESDMLAEAANAGNLTFSHGAVNANISRVNDSAVTGAGTSADPWGP